MTEQEYIRSRLNQRSLESHRMAADSWDMVTAEHPANCCGKCRWMLTDYTTRNGLCVRQAPNPTHGRVHMFDCCGDFKRGRPNATFIHRDAQAIPNLAD